MLYQTLPLCCPFNLSSTTFSSTLHSFSSSVSVTASSCPLPPPCPCCCPSSSQVQAKAEMDCIEAKALKGSSTEVAFMKSSQQAIHEYSWVANGPSTVVSADDLFVDEFLEFPNDDVEEGLCKEEEEEEEEEEEGDKPCSSVSFPAEQPLHENSNSNSAIFSVPELSVPADDLADLEWLSHFVEDSFLEFSSVPYPSTSTPKEENQNGNQNLTEQGTERASVKQPSFCFPTPVPCKARSKRPRTGGRTRTWSIGSLSFTESSSTYSSSSTSSTTTTSSYSSPMSLLTLPEKGHNMDMLYYLEKPAVKKPKKEKRKLVGEASGNRQQQQQQQQQQQPQAPRRCSHCHVQKTPQWRAGPLGAKTLCNACGVRYKSGRLLPEYRPACSPTFSGDIHSNSHRKVLEMRRKKESGFTGIEISSWVPAVQSW